MPGPNEPPPQPRQLAVSQDFVAGLPEGAATTGALDVAHAAARRFGVALESVQVQESAAGAQRLGYGEMTATVTGSYESVKLWLGEVVTRAPAATVSSFRLQRAEQPAPGVQGRVTVRTWSRPTVSPPER
jgi:hypothetical protein